MADEEIVEEEITEDAVEEDASPADEDTKQAAADEKPADKETKTLLSDDEGDGSDDVEYEFTPPEGALISEEAQSMIDAFKENAAELGLSSEQYQKLIEYDLERGQNAMAQQAGAYQERIAQWGEEVKADKELGGENLNSNLATIKAVTDAYGDAKLMSLMKAPSEANPDGLGLGNHPDVLRFLHRIGKSLADSDFIEGDGHKAQSGDGLQRMYPTMFNA